jgi:HK97 family phage portal protein
MSVISWLFGGGRKAGPADRNPASEIWWQDLKSVGRSTAGPFVSADTAMRLAAVHACVRVLADSLATLPLKIMRKMPGGDVMPAEAHPLNVVFGRRPNQWQNAYQFKQMMMGHLALRGNAYARILQGPLGPVSELVPLHPDRVRAELIENGRVRYVVSLQDGRQETLTQDEVWHLRGLVTADDGVTGLDPISAMREAIGMGLAAQDYGGTFFRNDARPSGILKHPAHFANEEDRKTFKAAWREAQGGDKRFSTAVLEFGMDYQQIGMTNEQAQFLETRKLTDVDIARGFRIQPHKIGILDRASFSNIEMQALEFVTDTLMPWLVNWEAAINSDLIMVPDRFVAKFTVNGLLRGAIKDRFAAYAVGRQWGWLSVNDVRRLEDMNSIGPEGDMYLVPMNMTPADQLENEDDDEESDDGAMPGDTGDDLDERRDDAPGNGEDRRGGASQIAGRLAFAGRRHRPAGDVVQDANGADADPPGDWTGVERFLGRRDD